MIENIAPEKILLLMHTYMSSLAATHCSSHLHKGIVEIAEALENTHPGVFETLRDFLTAKAEEDEIIRNALDYEESTPDEKEFLQDQAHFELSATVMSAAMALRMSEGFDAWVEFVTYMVDHLNSVGGFVAAAEHALIATGYEDVLRALFEDAKVQILGSDAEKFLKGTQ